MNNTAIEPGSSNAEPLRVVLADDHAIVRAGLKAELGEGFRVVGEADDAEGAIWSSAICICLVVAAWPSCGHAPLWCRL
jgi:hypothetical protein